MTESDLKNLSTSGLLDFIREQFAARESKQDVPLCDCGAFESSNDDDLTYAPDGFVCLTGLFKDEV